MICSYCTYPFGYDKQGRPTPLCGNKAVEGSWYCAEHESEAQLIDPEFELFDYGSSSEDHAERLTESADWKEPV